ncbi:uncharacterized protein LOC133928716 isoform X1 [Phragmites australis]|uniref:uncharacterized protein LOC133928716 isoform X1 n=1 Tax=Phragmites australis TaxID=29695 RepID=UPI002D791820|nr:uncharacterized protein LOC133928716 isoform X1 [Phragmites australis]
METPVAEDLRATETEEADPPEKERVSAPATSTTTIVLSKTTLSRRKKLLQMFFSTILSLLWCALVRVFGQLISVLFLMLAAVHKSYDASSDHLLSLHQEVSGLPISLRSHNRLLPHRILAVNRPPLEQ